MEKNLFEIGADLDVEALTARIRESAKKRRTVVPVAPVAKEPERRALKTLQPQRLTQEILNCALSAEVINQVPLKRRGTKAKIEFRVKKFLKWLVHWNTKGQAEFNQSVTRSLGLIAQDLQTGQSNFTKVEDLLRDERERITQSLEEANQIAARLSGLEQQTSQKLRDFDERTAPSNQRVFGEVSRLSAILEEVGGRIELLAAHWSESERRMNDVLEDIRRIAQSDVAAAVARFEQEMDRSKRETRELSVLQSKLDHDLNEVRIRILRAERMARAARGEIDARDPGKSSEHPSDPQANTQDQRTNVQKRAKSPKDGNAQHKPFDYFLFEHRHRGPVLDIKRRQSTYLDLFSGKEKVVDLGCGRGEFVELLTENGINVTGVDSNEDMVDFCRDRGLTVVQADIFEYLAGLPDGELDGIFLSQVVEHLSPELILKLLSLCEEKLEPGAVIVIETVNTNCPAALSNFYLDPTHVRPVPAEMLRFMLEQGSFEIQYLRFSSPLSGNDVSETLDLTSGLTHEIMIYQDYAVVAAKR